MEKDDISPYDATARIKIEEQIRKQKERDQINDELKDVFRNGSPYDLNLVGKVHRILRRRR